MDLELYPKNNAPQIEGYGKDYIKISGNQIYSTVLLKPDKFIELGKALNTCNKNIIKNNILSLEPELIIYGSLKGLGSNSNMYKFLKTLNLPIEEMQIGSACRTWAVLIGDGRSMCAIIEPGE